MSDLLDFTNLGHIPDAVQEAAETSLDFDKKVAESQLIAEYEKAKSGQTKKEQLVKTKQEKGHLYDVRDPNGNLFEKMEGVPVIGGVVSSLGNSGPIGAAFKNAINHNPLVGIGEGVFELAGNAVGNYYAKKVNDSLNSLTKKEQEAYNTLLEQNVEFGKAPVKDTKQVVDRIIDLNDQIALGNATGADVSALEAEANRLTTALNVMQDTSNGAKAIDRLNTMYDNMAELDAVRNAGKEFFSGITDARVEKQFMDEIGETSKGVYSSAVKGKDAYSKGNIADAAGHFLDAAINSLDYVGTAVTNPIQLTKLAAEEVPPLAIAAVVGATTAAATRSAKAGVKAAAAFNALESGSMAYNEFAKARTQFIKEHSRLPTAEEYTKMQLAFLAYAGVDVVADAVLGKIFDPITGKLNKGASPIPDADYKKLLNDKLHFNKTDAPKNKSEINIQYQDTNTFKVGKDVELTKTPTLGKDGSTSTRTSVTIEGKPTTALPVNHNGRTGTQYITKDGKSHTQWDDEALPTPTRKNKAKQDMLARQYDKQITDAKNRAIDKKQRAEALKELRKTNPDAQLPKDYKTPRQLEEIKAARDAKKKAAKDVSKVASARLAQSIVTEGGSEGFQATTESTQGFTSELTEAETIDALSQTAIGSMVGGTLTGASNIAEKRNAKIDYENNLKEQEIRDNTKVTIDELVTASMPSIYDTESERQLAKSLSRELSSRSSIKDNIDAASAAVQSAKNAVGAKADKVKEAVTNTVDRVKTSSEVAKGTTEQKVDVRDASAISTITDLGERAEAMVARNDLDDLTSDERIENITQLISLNSESAMALAKAREAVTSLTESGIEDTVKLTEAKNNLAAASKARERVAAAVNVAQMQINKRKIADTLQAGKQGTATEATLGSFLSQESNDNLQNVLNNPNASEKDKILAESQLTHNNLKAAEVSDTIRKGTVRDTSAPRDGDQRHLMGTDDYHETISSAIAANNRALADEALKSLGNFSKVMAQKAEDFAKALAAKRAAKGADAEAAAVEWLRKKYKYNGTVSEKMVKTIAADAKFVQSEYARQSSVVGSAFNAATTATPQATKDKGNTTKKDVVVPRNVKGKPVYFAGVNQAQMNQATRFIGRGASGTLPAILYNAWVNARGSKTANNTSFSNTDKVFIAVDAKAVDGKFLPADAYKAFEEAIKANATIITGTKRKRDNKAQAGERAIAAMLRKAGYIEHGDGTGIWTHKSLTPDAVIKASAKAAPATSKKKTAPTDFTKQNIQDGYGNYARGKEFTLTTKDGRVVSSLTTRKGRKHTSKQDTTDPTIVKLNKEIGEYQNALKILSSLEVSDPYEADRLAAAIADREYLIRLRQEELYVTAGKNLRLAAISNRANTAIAVNNARIAELQSELPSLGGSHLRSVMQRVEKAIADLEARNVEILDEAAKLSAEAIAQFDQLNAEYLAASLAEQGLQGQLSVMSEALDELLAENSSFKNEQHTFTLLTNSALSEGSYEATSELLLSWAKSEVSSEELVAALYSSAFEHWDAYVEKVAKEQQEAIDMEFITEVLNAAIAEAVSVSEEIKARKETLDDMFKKRRGPFKMEDGTELDESPLYQALSDVLTVDPVAYDMLVSNFAEGIIDEAELMVKAEEIKNDETRQPLTEAELEKRADSIFELVKSYGKGEVATERPAIPKAITDQATATKAEVEAYLQTLDNYRNAKSELEESLARGERLSDAVEQAKSSDERRQLNYKGKRFKPNQMIELLSSLIVDPEQVQEVYEMQIASGNFDVDAEIAKYKEEFIANLGTTIEGLEDKLERTNLTEKQISGINRRLAKLKGYQEDPSKFTDNEAFLTLYAEKLRELQRAERILDGNYTPRDFNVLTSLTNDETLPLNKQNLVKREFVASRKPNPVNRVPNLVDALTEDAEFFRELFGDTAPQNVLLNFMDLKRQIQTSLDKLYSPLKDYTNKDGKLIESSLYQYRDFTGYLADDNGKLPDSVVTAITLAVYSWITTDGSSSLFNDEDAIKAILNLEETDILPMALFAEYSKIGTSANSMHTSLGKTVIKALQLRAKEDGMLPSESRFVEALGVLTASAMVDSGLITKRTKAIDDLRSPLEDVAVSGRGIVKSSIKLGGKALRKANVVNFMKSKSQDVKEFINKLSKGTNYEVTVTGADKGKYASNIHIPRELITGLHKKGSALIITNNTKADIFVSFYSSSAKKDINKVVRAGEKFKTGKVDQLDTVETSTPTTNQTAAFYKVAQTFTNNKGEMRGDLRKIVDDNKAYNLTTKRGLVDRLAGKITKKEMPSLVPHVLPDVVRFKNSGQIATAEQRDILQKQSNLPQRIDLDMHSLGTQFGAAFQMEIAGFKSDEEIENMMLVDRAGAISKNNSIQRINDLYQEFTSTLPDLTTNFYSRHELVKSTRIHMAGALSMQSDKFIRYMFGYSFYDVHLPLGADTNNALMRQLFLAAAEGLDISVDRLTEDAALSQVYALLQDDVMIAGLEALKNTIASGYTLEGDEKAEAEKAIKAAVKMGGMNTHSLHVLSNLAKVQLAIENGDDSVVVNITREIDGITNGVAIAAIMFCAGSLTTDARINTYNRFGLTFDGQSTSYAEWLNATDAKGVKSNLDTYQDIVPAWREVLKFRLTEEYTEKAYGEEGYENNAANMAKRVALQSIMDTAGIDHVALIDGAMENFNISKEERTEAKQLMTFVYGSSSQAFSEGIGATYVRKVFAALSKEANVLAKAEAEGATQEQIEAAALAKNNIKIILSAVNKVIGKSDMLLKPSDVFGADSAITSTAVREFMLTAKAEQQLIAVAADVYGSALAEAVESKYSAIAKARILINGAAHLAYEAFSRIYKYELKRAEAVERAKGGWIDGLSALTKEQEAEVLENLKDIMPIVDTYFTDSETVMDSGLNLMKTKRTTHYTDDRNTNPYYVNVKLNEGIKVTGKKNPVKSAASYGSKVTFAEPGVGATILSIHSTDASIMLKTYLDRMVMGVHDAVIVQIQTALEDGKSINEAFYDVVVKTDILRNALEMHNRSSAAIEKYLSTVPEADRDSLGITEAFQESTERFYKNFLRASDRIQELSDLKGELEQGVYIDFVEKFDELIKVYTIGNGALKEMYLEQVTGVNQYGIENGAYTREATVQPETTKTTETTKPKATKKRTPKRKKKAVDPNQTEMDFTVSEVLTPVVEAATNVPSSTFDLMQTLNEFAVKGELKERLLALKDAKTKLALSESKIDAIVELIEGANELEIPITDSTEISASVKGVGPVTMSKLENALRAKYGSEAVDTEALMDYAGESAPIAVSQQTAVEVFDQLTTEGNITDSPQHTKHLRSLVTDVFSKVLEPFNLYLREAGVDAAMGVTTLSDMYIVTPNTKLSALSSLLGQGLRMSAAEVYTHELVHNVVETALRSSPVLQRAALNLWKKAASTIKPEDFMSNPEMKDDPAYAEEYAAAKRRYDYIFDPSRSPNYLQEFIAHGVTNANFMKALSKLDATPTRKRLKGMSLKDKIIELYSRAVNLVFGHLARAKHSDDLGTQLNDLMIRMAELDGRKKRNLLNKYDRKLNIVNAEANKIIYKMTGGIGKLGDKWLKSDNTFKRGVGAVASLGNNGRTVEFMRVLQDMVDNSTMARRGFGNFIQSTLNEGSGRNERNGAFHDLKRVANNIIDQARQRMLKATKRIVNGAFSTPLTDEQKVAVTDLLRTDFNSVIDYFGGTVAKNLLTNPEQREQAIQELLDNLKEGFPNSFNYYMQQSRNLGYFMMHEKSYYNSFVVRNAKLIAEQAGIGVAPDSDYATAIPVIDALVSLYALRESKHIGALTTLVNTELDGIDTVLNMHRAFKLKSTQEFEANHIVKGYIPDMLDSSITYRTATMEEAEELMAKGFVRGPALAIDPKAETIATETVYAWICHDGGLEKYDAGIVNLANEKARGVGLYDIRVKQGVDPDAAAFEHNDALVGIGVQKVKQAHKLLKAGAALSKGPQLQPIFNPDGDITDFRYVMTSATKDNFLNRDLRIDEVMGNMLSTLGSKADIRENNKLTVDALIEHQQTNFNIRNAKQWEVLGPDSPSIELREIYDMLPDRMKAYLDTQTKGQGVLIERKMIPLLFGQRKYSVTEMIDKSPRDRRKFAKLALLIMSTVTGSGTDETKLRLRAKTVGDIVVELSKMAKDIIVIKTFAVTLGNTISNILLLTQQGVPLGDVLTSYSTAWTAARDFKKHSRELTELSLKLVAAPMTNRERRKMEKRIGELNWAINNNPAIELISQGVLQTIVEDVDTDGSTSEADNIVKTWVANKTRRGTKHIPAPMKKAINTVLLRQGTAGYDILRDAAQISDFGARFALYNHEKAKNPDRNLGDIVGEVMDIFIDYDLPTHRALQYANDLFIFGFTKYLIRVIRIIYKTFASNPAGVLSSLLLQNWLGDIPDIYDTSFNPLNRLVDVAGLLELPTDIASIAALKGLMP